MINNDIKQCQVCGDWYLEKNGHVCTKDVRPEYAKEILERHAANMPNGSILKKALKIAVKSVDKEIFREVKQKAASIGLYNAVEAYCPVCNEFLGTIDEVDNFYYCLQCGQKVSQ